MPVWTLDPTHTVAAFSARHMMITTVRGTMQIVDGAVNFDPANPAAASVEVSLNAGSINTGLADRDGHLKSPDFLDVANNPTVTFKSTSVVPTGEGRADVTGDLTIRGVTRPVTLAAEFLGAAVNPFDGSERAGFEATASINREDWGLTWNVAMEAGGVLVGKEIKLNIEAEVVRVKEAVTA
jgi:polyisoprenoid-binding protein YceI